MPFAEMSCNVDVDREECSACGKMLKEGDGRFRRSDKDLCIECNRKKHQCHGTSLAGKTYDRWI